ncbi:MAG: hypothetical protein DFNUSKGM_001367, partial [Candidatus Fervidibacter sacchari]
MAYRQDLPDRPEDDLLVCHQAGQSDTVNPYATHFAPE